MSLWAELKRRNVVRVGMAYVVASWLLIEASTVALDGFGAPDWIPKVVAVMLALGFPVAVFFAWAFEVTPEGIKREAEVDRSQSVTHHTGRRLDLLTVVMLVVLVALAVGTRILAPPESVPRVVAVADRPSIAVLPFANMSADVENEYFADGISEEILNLLAAVRGLSVASRTSAFTYKGSSAPVPEIAAQLGVQYVLEGSVRKAGTRIRVTAQLIDARSDRHLWSQTFDRALDDVFAIQDEIAGAIGDALQVELLGAGGAAVVSEQISGEIYAQYLHARYLLRRRNAADISTAIAMLQRVVEAEPQFAPGHAVLAEAGLVKHLNASYRGDTREYLAMARVHAERGRELNPDLSGVYLALGMLAQLDSKDMMTGIDHYSRAIALDPDEPRPYHWRAIGFAGAGHLDRAIADFETALRLEPENANLNGNRGDVAAAQGDYARAFELFERQSAYGNPISSRANVVMMEVLRGNVDAAARQAGMGGLTPELQQFVDALLAAAAQDPAAVEHLRVAASDGLYGSSTGRGLLIIGRDGDFLQWLMNPDSRTGHLAIVWHPMFRRMREDPRFVQALAVQGYLGVWERYGPPRDCRREGDTYRCGYGSE